MTADAHITLSAVAELLVTLQLHVMQRTVLLSQFCPSVCQMRVLW